MYVRMSDRVCMCTKHPFVRTNVHFVFPVGTSDDMEHNLSTFLTEMKECAYLLDNLTPRSLVIVDELGRGTSNIDGEDLIGWFVCWFVIPERVRGREEGGEGGRKKRKEKGREIG